MLKKGKSFYRQLQREIGERILAFAPYLMRTLSVLGTAAMFMVGGSIIGHGVPVLHHFSENIAEVMRDLPAIGAVMAIIAPVIVDGIIGLIVGAICVAVYEIVKKLLPKKAL
jgi:predicted DNA repair protein MutK